MRNDVGREQSPAIVQDVSALPVFDLLENVLNYRRLFFSVLLSGLLLGCLYVLIATPMYSANAFIQIEDKKSSALGSLSTVTRALDVNGSPILGEIDVARSRTVVAEAVDAAAAQTSVTVKNTFPVLGRWLATVLPRNPDGLAGAPLGLTHWAWGGENLTVGSFDVPAAQMGKRHVLVYEADGKWTLQDRNGNEVLSGKVGELAVSGDYRLLLKAVAARPGTEFVLVRHATQATVDQIIKKLNVAETKRDSGVFELEYNESNPFYAARLVNAIADAYLTNNVTRRAQESERSLSFLNSQIPTVRARLQKAEEALNTFRLREGSIDVNGEIKVLLDQSAAIEKARLETNLTYQDMRSKFQLGQPPLDAVLGKLKQLDVASHQLSERIAQLPGLQQEYLRLSRDVDVENQLYVGLMNNAQQLQIATASNGGNASIVDYAEVAEKPSRPNAMLAIVLGGVAGALFGFIATQLKALGAGRIRDPKRLEAVVGIDTLGILPISPAQQIAAGKPEHTFLISAEETETPIIEAMESLALAVQCSLAEKGDGKVVLITSAVPNQGKSLISANLAYLLAEKGLKTLLLDADMRKSKVHRYLSGDTSDGLSGVLEGAFEPADVISRPTDNFHALPAGKKTSKAAKLLSADNFGPVIASLREEYDVVIVDSPPVLPVLDAAALSRFADMTLFVARHGEVSYAEVAESMSRLGKVGTTVDGLVFNGFVPSPLRYGYYSNAYRYMSEQS
ncbi:polysaccharide biosynthesis tyrosine autokinase [Paraburkholderia sp. Ac-20336]|uniref:polysaccharide biosynthesis tyrosine autokinase n=1 Tax=unclassified Paraburkholderia TaxID=2615204 RepID=UPI00197EEA12|nr:MULTISPECIES: polysaccharide biosynthesis tyrosine autokinase [unclassified Paraburkholderia]MBN3804178.1 polysaccharide biosynthesis tyrosine autokinase [Paraburkholderia sp. Ac-20336]MBN3845300.1 polysaccharide biosynthesis tyrosine autokinase [Paraburkholderia sp. Ac-20342]